MSTVAQTFDKVRRRLTAALADKGEADAAARIIFEDVAGYGRNYLFINGDREMLPFTEQRILETVGKVEQGMPVQYAVGKALFMGNYYKVSPAVLIPRPETAGLVDKIVDGAGERRDLRVLDLGTGSGCNAIALARALPFSHVTGLDVSGEALELARANGRDLKSNVQWEQGDILALTAPAAPCYDIIVSNPPYVRRSEAADMDKRVLDYEPAGALFVPDDDPLLFYRAIARYAAAALVPGGRLYFEINQYLAAETRALVAGAGFDDVEVARDYKGAYRYLSATKPLNS